MKQNNSGQALLIILLIMAVALTIGLSVVSRSITDIRISQEQEESARAFSAAEAGLESLLATGGAPGTIGDFTIETETQELGNSNIFVFPGEGVAAGNIQTVWFVGHDDAGNPDPNVAQCAPNEIYIYWGNENTLRDQPDTPALEVTFFYKSGDSFETTKRTSDPYELRADSNGFFKTNLTVGPFDIGGKTFQFRRLIGSFPANIYVLRLKLIYSEGTNHALGIEVAGGVRTLPLQGNCFSSTASSGTTGIASKVEQCQLYPVLPGMFDYVLYSESSL